MDLGIDLDSLIPEELRSAASIQPEPTNTIAPTPPATTEPIIETPVASAPTSADASPVEEFPIDEIDKILGIGNQEVEDDEDAPFWEEDEDFTEIANTLTNYGMSKDNLNKLLSKVVDKSAVERQAFIKTLEERASRSEKDKEELSSRLTRYKEMERAVLFDQLPENQKKYVEPMRAQIQEIQKSLSLDGVSVPVNSILGAKNKAELSKMLQTAGVSDDEIVNIQRSWRAYKDTETEYMVEKDAAQKGLKNLVQHRISPETSKTIFKSGLQEFMNLDDKYSYIKNGLIGTNETPEEVATVVSKAQKNFSAMVDAFSAASEHALDDKWLEGLAKFMMNAAHAENIETKYYTLQKQHEETVDKTKKLAEAYKRLAGAARGITNASGMPVPQAGSGVPQKNVADEYTAFLKGDIDLSSILPGLKNL